jgi:hypothetical protein
VVRRTKRQTEPPKAVERLLQTIWQVRSARRSENLHELSYSELVNIVDLLSNTPDERRPITFSLAVHGTATPTQVSSATLHSCNWRERRRWRNRGYTKDVAGWAPSRTPPATQGLGGEYCFTEAHLFCSALMYSRCDANHSTAGLRNQIRSTSPPSSPGEYTKLSAMRRSISSDSPHHRFRLPVVLSRVTNEHHCPHRRAPPVAHWGLLAALQLRSGIGTSRT